MSIIDYNFSYKKLINELESFEYKYKLFVLEDGYLLEFIYKKNLIKIIFTKKYNIDYNVNFIINNLNIKKIYSYILKLNNELNNLKLYDLLFLNYNIKIFPLKSNIINYINILINYKNFFFYKKLLNLIILKYSNEEMPYLYEYLLQ